MEDLPQIAKLHFLAWLEAYSDLVHPDILNAVTVESRLSAWKNWFEPGNQDLHVLQHENKIRGFIRTSPARNRKDPPANFAELTHLYLHPSKLSSGSGHRLFQFATSICEGKGYIGMLLWTIEGNTRARRFYEAHGMRADGARDDEPDWLGEGVYELRYLLPFHARTGDETDDSYLPRH